MSFRLTLLVCLLFFRCVAFAQSTVVQSGAHEGFDRLVFASGEADSWQIRTNGETVVATGKGVQEFDISRIFDLIDRSRIVEVNAESGSQISLQLSCDCLVRMFKHRENFVVLDVLDSEPDVRIASAVEKNESPGGETKARLKQSDQVLPLVFGVGPLDPENGDQVEQGLDETADFSLDAAQVRDRIARQISGASSQGLLDPINTVLPKSRPQPLVDEIAESENDDLTPIFSPELGVSAHTSLDELSSMLGAANRRSIDSLCAPSFSVEINSWSKTKSFSDGLGELRANDTSSSDSARIERTLSLARFYLYFGFGSEAIAHLDLVEGYDVEKVFLVQLASFFEQPNEWYSHFFARYAKCGNITELWAFLTSEQTEKITNARATALVARFQGLSNPLQRHLGPVFVKRLGISGATDVANALAETTSKIVPEAITELELTQAEILISQNEISEARELISKIGNRNNLTTVRGFLQSVALSLSEGETPLPSDIALLDSYAREYRNTDISGDLLELSALARVRTGDITNGIEKYLASEGSKQRLEEILEKMIEFESIEEVLAIAAIIDENPDVLRPESSVKFALNKRLQLDGFKGETYPKATGVEQVQQLQSNTVQTTREVSLEASEEVELRPRGEISKLEELKRNLTASRSLREETENRLLLLSPDNS